ncbi:DUF1854 domain-containing protein [candidate division KSB1 bacterium]|nr:DUF1854 domain-containing protein [candidate division KSB1 bacterium]
MADNKMDAFSDANEYQLNFLEAEKLHIFRAGDALRMTIRDDRTCLRVIPMVAFPFTMRNRYISLRDLDGNELGIIRDPKQLDRQSRALLSDELHKRYFLPRILKINSLQEKMSIIEWDTETDRGPKVFITRQLHTCLKETKTGYLITDIENNRFEIHQRNELDSRSLALLSRYI